MEMELSCSGPEGWTTSNDITFGFSGQITPEGTEVVSQGFECRLNTQSNFVLAMIIQLQTSEVLNSILIYLLMYHTFEVRAFVVVGEQPRIV